MNLRDLLMGPNKYTTGLVFLLANMMGFFAKMKENKIDTYNTYVLLTTVILLAHAVS